MKLLLLVLLALPALAQVNVLWMGPGVCFNIQIEQDGTYKAFAVDRQDRRRERRGAVPAEEVARLVRELEANPFPEFQGETGWDWVVFSAGAGPRNDGNESNPACQKALAILRSSVVGRVRADLLKQLGVAPRSTAPAAPARP